MANISKVTVPDVGDPTSETLYTPDEAVVYSRPTYSLDTPSALQIRNFLNCYKWWVGRASIQAAKGTVKVIHDDRRNWDENRFRIPVIWAGFRVEQTIRVPFENQQYEREE